MSFTREQLLERLAALEYQAERPSRYVIAFSGGLDSSVLAHALADAEIPVLAVHIDHGLQREAEDWNRHCRAFAEACGIAFRCQPIDVQLESGKGPEGSARDARYSALHDMLEPGDWLLSAHHREDQAETLLLNLVRGSGPAGIAGIGALRRFGPGWLVRPLLAFDRAELRAYAAAHDIHWIEDPSNADTRFDRNFLRHEVIPCLQTRWPDIALRLQRSALHASEATSLLADLAGIDLEALGAQPQRLPIGALLDLPRHRQKNLVRHALRTCGLTVPTALQLDTILDEVLRARVDAQPLLRWPGGSARRYRDGLYLLPDRLADTLPEGPIASSAVRLGSGLGTLFFEPGVDRGLDPQLVGPRLRLAARKGGERIRLHSQSHTKKLKKLLQEEGVVPWMRDRVPLIYAGDKLVAVGDLWTAADATTSPGVAVRWKDRPALH
ncbi:MAG: tRNA lysidine(34) synthetase TilS [Gammaproteobacteria bacterium]|nr:tRNA lysidine(34) synthetase TilS [Gammaproteobacteria bacterium]